MWQVYALKYAERNTRTRADSFLDDDHPTLPHGMDYFIWVLRRGDRTILVDTGYDDAEGARRDRPIQRHPVQAIKALGLTVDDIDLCIVTHLHYDHAGGLAAFPKAVFHLQAAEMAFATGPCMCDAHLRDPFTAAHVCEMVRNVYSGRVVFHDGDGQVAPGVTVHCVGGHSKGMQAVRVETENGPLCLASDASHYYENFERGLLFPIVADKDAMRAGFQTIQDLAGDAKRVIPGHDPLVRKLYPADGTSGFTFRLDKGRL